MKPKKILILDYSVDRNETANIKRWLPADVPVFSLYIDSEQSFPDELIDKDFTHAIHSGSALSITETAPFTEKAEHAIRSMRDRGVAQMGICYGHQLICRALVGIHAVRSSPNGLEVGWNSVTFFNNARNLLGVGESEKIWQYHFDEVTELPEGSELLAANPHTRIQAYINNQQHLFGTQFHPEFDEESGNRIFLEDRDFLQEHGHDVDVVVRQAPSISAGKIFFDFFLEQGE